MKRLYFSQKLPCAPDSGSEPGSENDGSEEEDNDDSDDWIGEEPEFVY